MTAGFSRGPNRNRRRFIKYGGLLALAGITPQTAFSSVNTRQGGEKALWLHNTHTGESLKTVYWAGGDYSRDALGEIDFILRDHRSGETKPIAPRLLDLVYELNRVLGVGAPIHIISGYRSPATNAVLAARSGGVARHSLHVVGHAIDLRVPGRELEDVHRAALALRGGGVGYYPRSDFVHVDIGRVRSWYVANDYEINFNRYFFRYTPPRPLEEIGADIRGIETDILWMLAEVSGSTS